jgi:DNA-binding transcriptional LysR family regulator
MSGTITDLLAISDFNLVAIHGGVGRASRATGRPKATLSRRIMELEENLGLRLFERGKRELQLTQEGQAFHDRSSALLTELDQVAEDLRSGTKTPRGQLRVSAPALFSSLAMGRIAAGFASAFPEVRLEVLVEDRPVDLIEQGCDIAIRINPEPDETLVGKRFLRDELLLVAAPAFKRPRGRDPCPVRAVEFMSAPKSFGWTVVDREGTTFKPETVLKLGTLPMVRDAVVAGAGAAVLPHSLVADDLADGRLVSWGRTSRNDTEIWVLYSSRRLLSPRIAAFVAFLSESFPKGSPKELAAMRT